MGSNKRDLKAYVRYDGSGRVVAGSLILRRNKPKVGNWQEVQGYECCNVDQTPVLVNTEAGFPLTYASLEIGPENGNFYQYIDSFTGDTANDIDELASLFNNSFKNLGYFKVVDGNLYWTPSIQIAEFYAANHTTVLYAYAFSD
jgi:hypothetical protein